MNIVESLENLNVSEGCFNEIVTLVEEYINEISDEFKEKPWDKISDLIIRQRANNERMHDLFKKKVHGYTVDDVLKSDSNLKKAEDRRDKYEEACAKHKQAQKDGTIKPAIKKEEKEEKDE